MNLTNMQMIIDHTNSSNTNGLLLAVDYRKAFDTIRWELIFHAMELFGFGDNIISAVKVLFQNMKTCVLNRGFSSEYFHPSRGIRQRCCCSPSLFVIAVEMLALMVRKSLDIKGISLAGQQVKISQYADDATFFLSDFSSLDSLLIMLTNFASFSELHINSHKSYLLLLGHHLDPPLQHNIRIDKQVTILGIIFKNNRSDAQHYALNFAHKLEKIKTICSSWMNRNLSMKGKVLLITSLMSSILQYPCSSTPTPTRVIAEFKKIITNFFWNNKRGKVAYKLLVQDLTDGGIKLTDLETRIKATHLYWIKFLWNNPDSLMSSFIQAYLPYENIRRAITCKTNLATRLQGDHTFIKAILTTWARLHIHEPLDESAVQQEMIWDNDYICINLKPFTWPRWRDAGIIYINDLLHDSLTRFLSHTELTQRYGITTSFLETLQIRSAIPSSWKRKLTSPAKQDLQSKPTISTGKGNSDSMAIMGKPSKFIYYAIVKLMKPTVTSQVKWNDLFPMERAQAEEYWSEVYKRPYKVARDTKLQAFHFRTVHRFIPCNRFLKNIKIKRDDKCSYCPASDTIQHFLYARPLVDSFWKQIVAWFARETDVQLDVSLCTFLFGLPEDAPQARVINFILLFTKFFIYRQKLFHRSSLDLTHFLRELRQMLQVEKYITSKDNKRHLFIKWQHIYTALG